MTPEMLAKVRTAAAEIGAATVEFVEGEAEQLPFPDATFDVVISNGVIDLIQLVSISVSFRRRLVSSGDASSLRPPHNRAACRPQAV